MQSYEDFCRAAGKTADETERPIVCVQGLGFVGMAMATAVANACDSRGQALFNVVGVDLPTAAGAAKVNAINNGIWPISSTDARLHSAFAKACARGNLVATFDPSAYSIADTTIVDIHLDVIRGPRGGPTVDFSGLRQAIRTIGAHVKPGSLVLVETTVPPGTCNTIIAPELAEALGRRGLPREAVLLAHSYERIMPGKDYFDSIVNYWRVYAGHTTAAADAAEQFLKQVIHVETYPLTRLHSITASETAKVLENSFRAINIAFIEEWARFAEAAGIDLFAVIDAIRMRPTHANIRQPGFGVGGYCLTKDPLLPGIAARSVLGLEGIEFPYSESAVRVNAQSPLVSVARLRGLLGGSLKSKTIALMGVSYRQDVGDTRYSPSETFLRAAEGEGATVLLHDPLVQHWVEVGRHVAQTEIDLHGVDAVVFAVPHREYGTLDLVHWFGRHRPVVLDANRVLSTLQITHLKALGIKVGVIGNGHP
jgi:UDP-N-acetyl-D-glucosamine dehydrogenase